MSSFTFTLYTLGDVEMFRAALTAVSMAFSPSAKGIFVSSNGSGLGALALFGLLISFIGALLNQMLAAGGSSRGPGYGELLILVVAFSVMFVPKFDVQIEDYLDSAQVTKVSNVPLGVAFPASMMSLIVKNTNELVSTVYSTTNGTGFMNVVSPLRILNGLRYGTQGVESEAPQTSANLKNYVMYCLAGRPGFDPAMWRGTKIGTGFIKSIFDIPVDSGVTILYSPSYPNGTIEGCTNANQKLRDDITKMMDPSGDFKKIVNKTTGMARVRGSSLTKTTPLEVDDVYNAFSAIANASQNDAMNFALFSLFTPIVNGAANCAPNIANQADLQRCLAYTAAYNGAMEDSAAAGSLFQRVMYNGMNILLFLYFCMSPVIAIMMFMKGIYGGLKIAGAYLLFGAWSQSWFVGVTFVNFYIQKTIQNELDMLGGIQYLTPATYPLFLDTLTQKVGMAGDMIAAVPLLMMSLMTGSIYGLTLISGRMGGRDNYDQTVGSAPLAATAPLASSTSAFSGTMGINGMQANGYQDLGSIGGSTQLSNALQNSTQSQKTWGQTLQKSLVQEVATSFSSGWTSKTGNALSESFKAAGMQTWARGTDLINQFLNDKSIGDNVKAEFRKSFQGDITSPQFFGAKVALAAQLAKAHSADFNSKYGELASEAIKDTKNLQSSLGDEISSGKVQEFARVAGQNDTLKDGKTLGNTFAAANQYSKAEQEVQAIQSALAVAGNSKVVDTVRQLTSGQFEGARTQLHNNMIAARANQEFDSQFRKQLEFVNNSTGAYLSNEQKEMAAYLRASAMHDPQRFAKQDAPQLYGTSGVSGPSRNVDSGMKKIVDTEVKPAANVTGPNATATQIRSGAKSLAGETQGATMGGRQTVSNRSWQYDNAVAGERSSSAAPRQSGDLNENHASAKKMLVKGGKDVVDSTKEYFGNTTSTFTGPKDQNNSVSPTKREGTPVPRGLRPREK